MAGGSLYVHSKASRWPHSRYRGKPLLYLLRWAPLYVRRVLSLHRYSGVRQMLPRTWGTSGSVLGLPTGAGPLAAKARCTSSFSGSRPA